MSMGELTHEVHKMDLEKETNQDYFTQIQEVIIDHASRITLPSRALKSDIAQNASLADDNDLRIKQGLVLRETQVLANGLPLRNNDAMYKQLHDKQNHNSPRQAAGLQRTQQSYKRCAQ